MLATPIRFNLAPCLTQGRHNPITNASLKEGILLILILDAILSTIGLKGDTVGIDNLRGNIGHGIHCFFLCCPARLFYCFPFAVATFAFFISSSIIFPIKLMVRRYARSSFAYSLSSVSCAARRALVFLFMACIVDREGARCQLPFLSYTIRHHTTGYDIAPPCLTWHASCVGGWNRGWVEPFLFFSGRPPCHRQTMQTPCQRS